MLREHILPTFGGNHNGIPWRSTEIGRIEALSDAVFAFAITLLIVALEVPETFAELWAKMHGFVAFAVAFTLLFQVWYGQYIFFRRFGLYDTWTVVLNGALLFLVLFYVYPLKFLFSLLASEFMGSGGFVRNKEGQLVPMLENDAQTQTMMIIYGLGFAGVFAIFVLLYAHVLRLRERLCLSPQERFDARESLDQNIIMMLTGFASVAWVLLTRQTGLAGLIYLLLGPAITVLRTVRGRQRRRLFS